MGVFLLVARVLPMTSATPHPFSPQGAYRAGLPLTTVGTILPHRRKFRNPVKLGIRIAPESGSESAVTTSIPEFATQAWACRVGGTDYS